MSETKTDPAAALSRRQFLTAAGGAAAIASGAAVRAADAATSPTPRRGGSLRVALNGGSSKDTLNAKAAVTEADIARQTQLYDTLLTFNPQYQNEPALAESVEPSAQATVWTIRLRPGVVFHNGKPLTAQDVAYTFSFIKDPKSPGAAASRLSTLDVSKTQVLDDRTLRLTFGKPFSPFRDVLAEGGTAGVRIIPIGYDPKTPIGTGPFQFVSFTPGGRSVFKRNEHYWREGRPYLDEIVMIDFTDDSARLNALLSGQVDAVAGIASSQLAIIQHNPAFRVINSVTGGWNPITMRTDQAPFNDVRVRKAFRLLTNRHRLVQQVLAGQGTPANDLYARYDPAYNAALPQREVDLDQAKSLLKQAGQADLSAEIVTSPVSIGLVAAAEAFVQQAALAGVKLRVRQVEPSTFFSQFFLNAPLSQSYWATRNYLLQAADSMMPTAPYNETHWHDDRWLSLVTQGFSEADDGKRAALIHAAQKIEYDDGGYINWGWYNKLDAMKTNVQGIVPDRSVLSLATYKLYRAWLSS